MAVDIDYLTDEYFAFDKPIPFQVSAGNIIHIKPFMLTERKLFNKVLILFYLDKRDFKETEDKPDLDYLIEDILILPGMIYCALILLSQIGYKYPFIGLIDGTYIIGNYKKIELEDGSEVFELDEGSYILTEEWTDIKRIMLYQNDPDYDDSYYFDLTIRDNIAKENAIRSKGTVAPNLERQFNMITAHCGIPKSELMNFTLRGFKSLYQEVVDEAEFFASYSLRSRYAEKGKPVDHWVYKRKKNGLDSFATEASGFLKGLGMDANEVLSEEYNSEPEAFKNEVGESEIEEIRRKIASGEM